MTTDQLHYLVLIHRLGSMNKASEQAHLSQQALNASMRKLENEVGCTLFIRHARGVALTENGLRLERFAEETLQKLDDTLSQICVKHTTHLLAKEKLEIFFSPAIGNTFVPSISKIFSHEFPNTQLMLMEREATEIYEMIAHEKTPALGLFGTFAPPVAPIDCRIHPIYNDKLYIVVAKDHPLAKQKSVSLHTILKYPLTIYQGSHATANNVCTLLEEAGKPNYSAITNNLSIYQNTILYQHALGFINKSALKNNTALPEIINEIVTLPVRNCPPLSFLAIMTENYFNLHEESIRSFLHIYQSLF